jgi:hypothetical protein
MIVTLMMTKMKKRSSRIISPVKEDVPAEPIAKCQTGEPVQERDENDILSQCIVPDSSSTKMTQIETFSNNGLFGKVRSKQLCCGRDRQT